MTRARCVVCQGIESSPKIAQLVIDIEKGKHTKDELAGALGITAQAVSNHFKKCEISPEMYLVPSGKKSLPAHIDDLKEVLPKLVNRLNVWLKTEINPANARSIKHLLSELRSLVKDIATLEGTIKAPGRMQIENLNIQFNRLQAVIFDKMCPQCREEITLALESEL